MKTWPLMVLLMFGLVSTAQAEDAVEQLLSEYRAAGAGPFNAEVGEWVWQDEGDNRRSCASCHSVDPKQVGSHIRTGKRIEPMAPSVNPERLTDRLEIEKWLYRNCKWTLGRVCTAQESGNLLTYLRQQ